ncbi:hypothetical protein HJG54_07885 [Leptolyngbya sp. NK1-12]|uniref:Uncharacterized protein n=1 Tax=Leptolyngbya sp. NK1-12 TaxID=2547451 RepID=A0AA96WK16_9CYAN|nr:hypothetical protein [Leptolyngbya sp. NK1-12]WNZ22781.1 hypothetical protein HJG54_07885 [Leptolyngbya sp. NK1-12]
MFVLLSTSYQPAINLSTSYQSASESTRLNDVASLYTNDIARVINPQKQQYGLERLQKRIQNHIKLCAFEIHQAVICNVQQYIYTQKLRIDAQPGVRVNTDFNSLYN